MRSVVDGAWRCYCDGKLAEAKASLLDVLRIHPDGAEKLRGRWLLAMICHYRAEFGEACAYMPEPLLEAQGDGDQWAKDCLTLAHDLTMLGDLDRAEELVDQVERADLRWTYLSVWVPSARAWISFHRGDESGADGWVALALEARSLLRSAQAKRDRDGLEDPPFHEPGAIQLAVLNAALLLSARGRCRDALDLVLPLGRLFPPALQLLAVDPAFDGVREGLETRSGFEAWFQRVGLSQDGTTTGGYAARPV